MEEISAEPEVAVEEVPAESDEAPVEEEASAEPEPAVEEGFKIYIGNLSFDYEQEQIEAMFTPFGTIIDAYVPTDKFTSKPRGFAFITMSDRETGEAAVEALNGSDVGGRLIRVNEQKSKEQLEKMKADRKPFKPEINGTKIYVGNLPFDAEKEELLKMFGEFGTVNDCFVPSDRETGRPRGFAFVTMADEDAQKAIDALDNTDLGGRVIVVNKSLPRGESAPAKPKSNRVKMYVGNVSFNTEEDEILSLFSEYGEVLDCYVPRDRETGRSRGFAFVTMSDESANAAIEECDGYELDGRILRVNEAQPKGGSSGGSSYGSGGGGGGGYSAWGTSGNDDSWGNDSY